MPSEAYTTTLSIMVVIVKGGGFPPSLGWTNFSIMIECTPESGICHSVFVYNLIEIGRGESGVGAVVSFYVTQG